MYELKVTRHFAAAHQLREYKGKCENIHGHNYQVNVYIRTAELNNIGLAIDFKELKQLIDQILDLYDHHLLNDVPPFDKLNPSAENIARVLYDKLKQDLPSNVAPDRVEVYESRDASATYFE